MQSQDNNHTKALHEPASRLAANRRVEKPNYSEAANIIGVGGYDMQTVMQGNSEKGIRQPGDPGQLLFGARPCDSGPSRPYGHGRLDMGYSTRVAQAGYRDSWMGKSMRMPGIQYHYPPSGVYPPEFVTHEMHNLSPLSPKAPYLDYDQAGYPYYMGGGVHYQRRPLSGQPRSESRFAMDMNSIPSRMGKGEAEPAKNPKQTPALQSPKFQMGSNSTISWYERSAASFEKSKEIFDFISKRCESQEYSHSDQEKLVHITKERTVRQLDFNAASQALKAAKVMETRWSTEPNGDGFRTAAKDIRGLIENNSIDATRMMYPISDVCIDPREAENIAVESESADKRAVYMKQYAETTAQAYGIPLYTQSDNFLEYAEQAYLLQDADTGCAVPSSLDDPQHVKQSSMPLNMNKPDQLRACAPQTSLALFVNNPALGAEQMPTESPRNISHLNMPKVPQMHNIMIKDAHMNSLGTFDRKSNTWNPNHDSFSPNYDSYAIGHLPWMANDDIAGTVPNENFEELSSGGIQRAPVGIATEACSSKEESKSACPTRTTECKNGLPKQDAPLCFCGSPCQKKQKDDKVSFWGCKTSKCHAEMPIISEDFKQVEWSPKVDNKSKSGRKLKPSKRLDNGIESKKSSQTEKCSEDEGHPEKKSIGRDSPLQKRSSSLPSKNPMSIESSGLKDSGTVLKLDSYRCRKSLLCDRANGHRGKCSKTRNSTQSSAERHDKKIFNVPKTNTTHLDQFCSPDKSAYHPEEELILTRDGFHALAKQPTSSENKDQHKQDDKNSNESTKLGKDLHVTSDVQKQVEVKTAAHEFSSATTLPSKEESRVRKREEMASAKLLDIAELAREELSKIPVELRCTKRRMCLNINGHVGRCRERPRAAGNIKIRPSKKDSPENGNLQKKQKRCLESAEMQPRIDGPPSKNVDAGSTIMSTSTDVPRKPDEKTTTLPAQETQNVTDGGNQMDLDASDLSPKSDLPLQDPVACKQMSCTLLASSKDYVDGLHLLKYEFEKLSSEHIIKFYGCSQVFPVDEWSKQKGEYLSQCSILKHSPPLHSSFMFKSRKNRLAATGCKSITLGDLQKYILKREKSLYEIRTSEIHGYGLFASSSIKSETPITELLGEYISHEESLERIKVYQSSDVELKDIIGKSRGRIEHPGHMIFRIDQTWDLDATKAGSCARFVNHSCSPNCEIRPHIDPAGAVHLVLQSVKDVKEGEELTFNYEDLGALNGFTCSCKSPSCQKGIY